MIRIGVLGAAKIVPMALIRPARYIPGISVHAVAAREPTRAKVFARKHGIPVVHADYATLLTDPDVDAVYIPLPIALHGEWTRRALLAGKHVLCEKPFAANADEAEQVAAVADATGLVCMQAFHYRYHALFRRLQEVLPEIGTVRHYEASLQAFIPSRRALPWNLAMGGGALMDVGCYPVDLVRALAEAEPEVIRASAEQGRPGIDRKTRAELRFTDGRTATVTASILSPFLLRARLRVDGDRGTIHVRMPFHPHLAHRLLVVREGLRRVERVPKKPSTFQAQLAAFACAVDSDGPCPTDAHDAVRTMRVVDAIYRTTGLGPRQPLTG